MEEKVTVKRAVSSKKNNNTKKETNSKASNVKKTSSQKKSSSTKKSSGTVKKKSNKEISTPSSKKLATQNKLNEKAIISNPIPSNNSHNSSEINNKKINVKFDKKVIILLLIVTLSMLALVIGATYAYFNVTSDLNTSTSRVTTTTDSVGTIALVNPTSSLHVRLSGADMMQANAGTSFYATSDSQANYDATSVPRVVAKATVSGGSSATQYSCSFNFNVELTGTMVDVLQTGDARLILSGAYSGEFDVSSLFTSKRILFDSLSGSNTEQVMYAVVEFNNTSSVQDYLKGKSLSMILSNSDFECTIKGS